MGIRLFLNTAPYLFLCLMFLHQHYDSGGGSPAVRQSFCTFLCENRIRDDHFECVYPEGNHVIFIPKVALWKSIPKEDLIRMFH